MDSPGKDSVQEIAFKSSEHEYYAKILTSKEVNIYCSSGTHNHGSSKVKLTNVVDYQWEQKYYVGHMIAIHISGKIFAYAIKGKTGGLIRLARTDGSNRALIKDIKGLVQDIAFAFTTVQILLGFADEEGNLYVYNVEESDKMACSLLLQVAHSSAICGPNMTYRIIWCPYVPSQDENPDTIDDPAKLLVYLNGNKAEIWDVSVVSANYKQNTPLEPSADLQGKGYVDISGHTLDIIDASFSPDGTAIATASLDGFVKFFQVYSIENETPRCLHQWSPHDGKALSCLFFLDNINGFTADSKFWKFAVTGANKNSEIKIWSCENWSCQQTLHFKPNPTSSPLSATCFKVCMDATATFLLLSEINSRLLYVLQINKNEEEKSASVDSVAEFLLPAPFLSFCIAGAVESKPAYGNSTEDVYRDEEDFENDGANVRTVSISLYTVQPKRLQGCIVTYQPEYSSALSYDGYGTVDCKSEVADNEPNAYKDNKSTANALDDLQPSVNLLLQQQPNPPLTLMTPDDFNSPIVNSSPSSLRNLNDVGSPSLIKTENTVDDLIDYQQSKDNFASGGSSPSREVQEILSFNNGNFKDAQEYFDNLAKMNADGTADDDNFEQDGKLNVWLNLPAKKAIEIQMTEENRRKNEEDNNWHKAQLQALNYRITNLESLIREQNSQIQKLQVDPKSLRHQPPPAPDYDLRSIVSDELDAAMGKSHAQTAKLIENYLVEQRRVEREQMEVVVANIMKTVCQSVRDNLQEIVSREVSDKLSQSASVTFNKLSHDLDVKYSQKLNTIDQLLKSNISKLVNSKQITESLSMTVVSIIKPSLEAVYKDMITTTLIPSWEKVCNSMFLQIHNTFTQGTKEYTSSVESYMDRQRRVQDKGKDLIAQMQSVSESMKNSTDKLTSHLSHEIQRQFQNAFSNMQETLKTTIVDHVKEQIKAGFKTHAAALEDSVVNAVRSRAVTPSPHVLDTQVQLAQIQSLIATGNIDIAFQQALSASASASDLSLVLYICEKVNPQDIFMAGNCVLQQHVLLSLIQQLGADLNHHTDIKLRYLEEGILSLDPKSPITREHLPVVLRELSKQLLHYILNNPTSKYLKSMRMLQMATQSVLKS